MATIDLTAVQGTKEKTLVQHDCKKLEIKKLRDTVNVEADRVYGLENRKYQLEMSMEEREKEISEEKESDRDAQHDRWNHASNTAAEEADKEG